MSKCKVHFLNVLNGDCTIIEHETGRVSVIDICNGNANNVKLALESNFNRQNNPTNPINYLSSICNGKPIFRFILTHPDMDHMDGIQKLFATFEIWNFWDTNHQKKLSGADWAQYRTEDWKFYESIRQSESNPKTIHLYVNCSGEHYTNDGFEIISPSKELVNELQKLKNPDWNEISYVILHKVFNRKILYCGDSGNKAWQNIMDDSSLLSKIKDIDILLAPHHGRKTGGDDLNQYLDKLNPKLAILGNTENSQHKNYSAFYNRNIPILTNNEAGDIVITIKKNSEICISITQNDWHNLLKTKNENWENMLNRNNIYLNGKSYE